MAALRRGDLGAFEDLVRAHKDPLYAYFARMVGDRSWAEDLCQETFLRVYRSRDEYVERNEFRAWLFRIARNLALDFLRREKRRRALSLSRATPGALEPDFVPAGALAPPEELATRELARKVEEAILDLPPRFRNVFVLCAVEGLSYEEVARVEGCPVKTVSSRLSRARRRFQRMIDPYLVGG